jgi:hypothetical protein
MPHIQREGDHDQKRHDAERGVTMQSQSQEQAAQQKIVTPAAAQAAHQIVERDGREQRVERKTQPDAADDVGPECNAAEEKRQPPCATVAQFTPQQVEVRQRENTKQGGAELQALEGEAGAKELRHQQGPVHLKALAAGVAREEDGPLSLSNVVNIEDFLSMIAEGFSRRDAQTMQAVEDGHAQPQDQEQMLPTQSKRPLRGAYPAPQALQPPVTCKGPERHQIEKDGQPPESQVEPGKAIALETQEGQQGKNQGEQQEALPKGERLKRHYRIPREWVGPLPRKRGWGFLPRKRG